MRREGNMHKILDKIERMLDEFEGRELTSSTIELIYKLTDIPP